ncbi:hypothetical protein KI387_041164, partial [Taxus chinensis]
RSGLKHLFDLADQDEDGPIELPEEFNPFEVPEATPLQTAASVLLTASIAFLLYRSLKRRAKGAKEKVHCLFSQITFHSAIRNKRCKDSRIEIAQENILRAFRVSICDLSLLVNDPLSGLIGVTRKFRSSGVESVREEAKSEALKALKQLNSETEEVKPNGPPPSAVQALVGAIMAGGIAFLLYNFTISVQSSLDSQVVSTNYSIRQITITI